jgi:hypothetical protein
MNNMDYDLKLFYKRVLITMILFVVIFGIHLFTKEIKGAGILDKPTTETLVDTIYVRSKDLVMSRIVVTYELKIDPHKRNDFNLSLLQQDEKEYYNRLVLYPVKDALRTNISQNISFDDDEVLMKYKQMVNNTIESELIFPEGSGITWESYQISIEHEESAIVLLLNRLSLTNEVLEAQKALMEAERLKKEINAIQ